MGKIKVTRPTRERLEALGTDSWAPWECEVSEFDWEYDDTETAYILEGEVVVTAEDGEKAHIKAGDLVQFPAGMKCTWSVKKPIRKVYTFDPVEI